MKITEFSLRNPLVVAALTLAIALFGLSAYLSMGISLVPNLTEAVVTIVTTDAGADPATIETQVTKPIEDAVATLPNIDTLASTSGEGVSSVVVQFATTADPKLAPVDVERVVSAVRSKLPTDADAPSIAEAQTSAIPVITVAVSGPQSLEQLQNVAQNQIEPAFAAVLGVQSVATGGGEDREIQVKVDPLRLEAYGIGLNTVQQAISSAQLQEPAGTLTSGNLDVSVRLNALAAQPSQLGTIVLASSPAGTVYLKDVATIADSHTRIQVLDRVNGVPAVSVTVTKLASANTIAVSQGVRQAMAQLQPTLPAGMTLGVVTDAATYTQQSFHTIQTTLLEAALFTGLILLLFLHTWRSTLIILVAIPTSLLTTFGLMSLLGMNLNLFSMLALVLSIGILVDDSIVVLENIFRHLGLGEPPILAAIAGRSEIGLAAITITFVDVVVWAPIALISGVVGDIIRPFALVIAAATLTSLLVSFTLTPLLASRLLHRDESPADGAGLLPAFGQLWDRGFAALGRTYQGMLRAILIGRIVDLGFLRIGARWAVIALGLVAFVAGLALFRSGLIGIDIFPSGDQSEVDVTLTMPAATDLQATNAAVQQIEQKLRTVPEVRSVYASIGSAAGGTAGPGGGVGTAGGNIANLTILLVPTDRRHRSSAGIAAELGGLLDPHMPGSRLDVSLPSAINRGGGGVSQSIQVTVQGPDPTTLDRLVDQVTSAVKSVPGTVGVNSTNQNVQPAYVVQVDRARAANLGVSSQSAATALRIAVDGLVVGEYQQPGQSNVDIRLMTGDAFRASPANLVSLPLLSTKGTIVLLGQIGTIVSGSAPTQITHLSRQRSVSVFASVSGRTIGVVQQDVQRRLGQVSLPPGYRITYQGQAAQGQTGFTDIFKALGFALLLMYLLMLLLFGSVTLPLAVLMSLPLAIVGAFGALALSRSSFTLFSLLGVAMLVGIVGKNAILLVDYTDTLRKRGYSRTEALLEAGPTRLRPIVMTTMAILTGLAPVSVGFEVGSELLRAAALVMMGGLLTSTLLTLVFVPAMYTIFDDVQELIVRGIRRIARPRPLEPVELAVLQRGPAWRPTTADERQPAATGGGRQIDSASTERLDGAPTAPGARGVTSGPSPIADRKPCCAASAASLIARVPCRSVSDVVTTVRRGRRPTGVAMSTAIASATFLGSPEWDDASAAPSAALKVSSAGPYGARRAVSAGDTTLSWIPVG